MAILTGQGRQRVPLKRLAPTRSTTPATGAKDDLDRDILTTEIDPRLARMISVAFVAAIIALPIAQGAIELARRGQIQVLEVLTQAPTRNSLQAFEKELARQSYAQQFVQPRLQLGLSRGLGFGSSNVILGRAGWLFYRPGIDWLTGPGMLDATRLALRKKDLIEAGEANPAPDPRLAIRAFLNDCRNAGVELVIVPVPDKATVQSAELTVRFAGDGPRPLPVNADYQRFLDELRSFGVDVFDPTPKEVLGDDPPRFLRQDTHWTPRWMETVASNLADHLKTRVPTLRAARKTWSVEDRRVGNAGDIAEMLKLPPDQQLYLPETVTIHCVVEPHHGRAWQPSPDSDVLLLGDSFSNIYTTADLGWGESAGFPAQLSRFLGRDVDVVARNGSGAAATRRELARRPKPLTGKVVVVWEFAARELMLANWEVVPMPATRGEPSASQPTQAQPDQLTPIVLEATIVATSRVPAPFTVPYKDCLTYMKLRVDRVVDGRCHDTHVIAVFWGMKDNVRLPAADYAVGKLLRLKLVSMRKAPINLRSARSADDLDDYEHQPYYVLEERSL